ncbi:hypothetical protein [Pseudoduganella violacea]|uniref:AlgX/AlgJ SGNH hydrolase-like domain-containing protein n=1 Tax=Pseudoduganella violacea TaxID=1715466 RepID=A0A7W5BEU4_9BURK|nr:hypothetical protein [Pseudoduganella violacea]MBB3121586.1 hypothetical protein [Pseudoduganella violacea]
MAKAAVVLVLALPAIAGLMKADKSSAENRRLATLPALPHSWQEFLRVPGQLDAWANDHFGMRDGLVRSMTRLRYRLFGEFPTSQVARGRHGRNFLASHSPALPPFSAVTAACGIGTRASPGTVEYINRMFADFHRMGLQPRLLIVPSVPPVYSADMPAWLEQRCASPQTPVTQVLDDPQLVAEARQNIYYPLGEMRAIAARGTSLFPKNWFHWSGPGLGEVAQLSVQHFWQGAAGAAQPPLRTREDWLQSDIAHLFPGLHLGSVVTRPDYEASGVQACRGDACFPDLQGVGDKLGDVSLYRNPAAPARRLVLVTDSFGSMVAGWYARHYRTVEHFATNNMGQLSAEEIGRLKRHLFADAGQTDLLFLYHDGGAIYNVLKAGAEPLHRDAASTVVAAH